jgi:hypothetical protein
VSRLDNPHGMRGHSLDPVIADTDDENLFSGHHFSSLPVPVREPAQA